MPAPKDPIKALSDLGRAASLLWDSTENASEDLRPCIEAMARAVTLLAQGERRLASGPLIQATAALSAASR